MQASDDYTRQLDAAVNKAHMNKEWRVEYMKTYFHDMDVRDEGIRIGRAEGISQGISQSIIDVLEEYGTVSDNIRSKIFGQNDVEVLKKWLKIAVKVSSVEEFEEYI